MRWGPFMRIVLALLLSLCVFSSDAAQAEGQGQQSPQTYTPQTYTPQTYSPQGHTPQSYAPQTYAPQTGENQGRSTPRRRLVKCMMSSDQEDYCVFYSDRD